VLAAGDESPAGAHCQDTGKAATEGWPCAPSAAIDSSLAQQRQQKQQQQHGRLQLQL
jgi:hypothetical protein